MRRTGFGLIGLTLAAVTLVSCGSDDDGGPQTARERAEQDHESDEAEGSDGADRSADEDDDAPLIPEGGSGPAPPPTVTEDGGWFCFGEDVHIQGDGLEVGLAGTCGEVWVEGTGNTVQLDAASSIVVDGSRHQLQLEFSAGQVTLNGDSHDFAFNTPGAPLVEDLSANSTLEGNYVTMP